MSDVNASENTRLVHGSMVKALGGGKFGGFGVYFTGPEEVDCDNEYFSSEMTLEDFELADRKTIPILYAHGLDPKVGRRRLARASFELKPQGLWVEGRFADSDSVVTDIESLMAFGKVSYSSSACPHMTEKERQGSVTKVKTWPIAEVSFTTHPCCAFGTQATVLKAFETYSLSEEIRRMNLSPTQLLREQSEELRALAARHIDNGKCDGDWNRVQEEKYARFVADVEGKRARQEAHQDWIAMRAKAKDQLDRLDVLEKQWGQIVDRAKAQARDARIKHWGPRHDCVQLQCVHTR